MIKKQIIIFQIILVIVFLVSSCDEEQDQEQGGEFFYVNEDTFTITTTGYSGGIGPLYFGNVMGIAVEFDITNSSADNRQLIFHYGPGEPSPDVLSCMLLPGEKYFGLNIIRINEYSVNDRLYVDTTCNLTDMNVLIDIKYYIAE